jgi:hypothetical protein
MKNTTVFWDVTPCSLVEVYQRFGGTCYLHLIVETSITYTGIIFRKLAFFIW